jgi:hypothetical protein
VISGDKFTLQEPIGGSQFESIQSTFATVEPVFQLISTYSKVKLQLSEKT